MKINRGTSIVCLSQVVRVVVFESSSSSTASIRSSFGVRIAMGIDMTVTPPLMKKGHRNYKFKPSVYLKENRYLPLSILTSNVMYYEARYKNT